MCCKGHKEMLLCLESLRMKAKLNVQATASFQLAALHDSCYWVEGSLRK